VCQSIEVIKFKKKNYDKECTHKIIRSWGIKKYNKKRERGKGYLVSTQH